MKVTARHAAHSPTLPAVRVLFDRFWWWPLPAMLVGFAVAALAVVQRPAVVDHMEQLSLASSQETWLRLHDPATLAGGDMTEAWLAALSTNSPILRKDEPVWLMPSLNGVPRVFKPPLLVWANLLAWADLSPATSTPADLAWRARLVGIGWLLLLIAATWWAGLTLGGPGVAHAAAAVVGSCFFLIREAHHATYDLPLTALLMLATAATLAGMRRNSRRPWLAAGAALGLALMAKSLPLALVLYLLPTLAAAALWTDRRRGVWLGLAAVVAIGLLIAGPWHLWMLAHYPTGGGELVGEWRAGRSKSRGVFYYVPVIVALGLPWSTWLGLALWEPWRRGNDAATRRAALAVWAGFAGIFLMFSLHPAKSNRYLLPALGLWALLTAVTVTTRLRQRRATDAGRDVTSLHFPILGVVSLALAVLLAVPGKNGANVIGGPMVPIGWAVASGVVLLAVVAAGIIVYRRHAIGPIVALTTMWGLIAGPLAFGNYYGGERGVMPNRPLADRLHTEPAPAVVVWPDQVQPPPEVNEGLLFYGRRVVPTVTGDAPGSWVLEAGEGDELRVIAEP